MPILAEGRLLWGKRQERDGVVERRNQGGDDAISFLAFTPPKPPFGEDWHPTLATHKKMSAELNAHLRKELGW